MDFIAAGDNCADVYEPDKTAYPGGCSLNFAVYIRQMGGHSSYLGAIGADKTGDLIRTAAGREGVDLSHLHVLPGRTACTRVSLENGDRKFLGYDPGVLTAFHPDREDLEFIRQHQYLHTSVFGGMDAVLGQLKGRIRIGYDFANKLTRPDIDAILELTDFAFFSYQKEDSYIREFLVHAAERGVSCAVATLGENGSLAYDGTRFWRRLGEKIRVVDTIGAGDSFIAGFLYGSFLGEDVEGCLRRGAKRAEKTISYSGAF